MGMARTIEALQPPSRLTPGAHITGVIYDPEHAAKIDGTVEVIIRRHDEEQYLHYRVHLLDGRTLDLLDTAQVTASVAA
jgi:hypothetical protein